MKESRAWLNLPNFLEMINIIAKNSNKGRWDKKPHMSIQLELEETTRYTHILLKHGMLYYFTDRCSMLSDLNKWMTKVLAGECLWSIHHVKFVGMNFYLIIFKKSDHYTQALAAKLWFVERNYMYTF